MITYAGIKPTLSDVNVLANHQKAMFINAK